ncbi:cation-translocating P-type ATPase [Mesomycoplasma ovipneumoniae]|uniref:cation-translocating P-type ATPase n=1 Tax=Mesomycoplasma ovipneumoniae TaxID=29562 RepID=UPI0026E1F357|nr:cation-translocating P-type ATPase [Mesomycoplasma ovipneumoniae]MDO6830100.1 cation-translocating P-type ATPase [Mesomycoplasma ovipneumoniae]
MIKKEKKEKIDYKNSDKITFLEEIDKKSGLNQEQLEKSKNFFGENRLPKIPEKSIFFRILLQLKEPLTLVLIFVIIISVIISSVFEHDLPFWAKLISYLEPVVIALIIAINVFFSLVQETKSKKAIDAISDLNSPVSTLIRDGKKISLKSDEILVGDILEVSSGDLISADGLVIENKELSVSEAILTGESTSVFKDEFKNWDDKAAKVYSGTSVLNGQAKILVSDVGQNTELGKIASLVTKTAELESPLQKKIAKFSKIITFIAAFLAISFFFIYIFLVENGDFNQSKHAVIISLSLAIGFIPEGLIPLVTINLIIGVKKLAKNNAIVKDLKTIETLGAVSIVCSDKTGTITENKMQIREIYYHQIESKNFWTQAVLNTTAYSFFDNSVEKYYGDPEEILILQKAKTFEIQKEVVEKQHKFLDKIVFNSKLKYSATFYEIYNKKFLFIKGAPEIIFKKADNLDPILEEKLTQMQNLGYRIFAFGYREIENELQPNENLENYVKNINISGLVCFQDPPRKEIKPIVKNLLDAEIKTIMITGDNFHTAATIAKNVEILGPESLATGNPDWKKDDFWRDNVEKFHLYSRVQPEDKLEIVGALQTKKHVVAMLGDGVNDAPSLKKADVGFAMGITGSQVSKQVANVVLADDNFKTLYQAIKIGRNIVANIKKLFVFLLVANFSMLLSVIFATLLFKEQIFTSLQILWINVVSETFGGIALGLTNISKNVMNQGFLNENKSLFNKKLIFSIMFWAIFISFLALLSFWITNSQTFSFLIISISLSSLSYILAADENIFKYKFADLKFLHLGFLASFGSILIVSFIPGINFVFSQNDFSSSNYLILKNNYNYLLLLTIFAPFVLDQILKFFKTYFKKF